jgi:hypothetical protein
MVKAVALLREPRDGEGVGGWHEDQGPGNPQQYAASDIQVKNVCGWTVEEKHISIVIDVKQIAIILALIVYLRFPLKETLISKKNFYHILFGISV